MRILDIEQLFQSEKGLEEVLNKLELDFEKNDYWAGVSQEGLTSDPQEARKALCELAGVYSNLVTILAIANTEKKNREIKYYNKLKIDMENEGKKFISAVAERQASEFVGDYRRIRNVIQGYINGCDKMISSLQSTLKSTMEDYKHSNLSGGGEY